MSGKPTKSWGGRRLQAYQMRDFNNCVDACGLKELFFSVPKWTWSKGKDAKSRIVGKLDRALINQDWENIFPLSFSKGLPPLSSDNLRYL